MSILGYNGKCAPPQGVGKKILVLCPNLCTSILALVFSVLKLRSHFTAEHYVYLDGELITIK